MNKFWNASQELTVLYSPSNTDIFRQTTDLALSVKKCTHYSTGDKSISNQKWAAKQMLPEWLMSWRTRCNWMGRPTGFPSVKSWHRRTLARYAIRRQRDSALRLDSYTSQWEINNVKSKPPLSQRPVNTSARINTHTTKSDRAAHILLVAVFPTTWSWCGHITFLAPTAGPSGQGDVE